MTTQALVLDGVTIVDTHTGGQARGMAIAIEDGKIARVEPAGAAAAGGTTRVIDGQGKFVVPGYLDMHAHPLGSRGDEGNLSLMLAHGITGFRQMSGSPEMLASRRKADAPPFAAQPELLVMPGTILTPFNAGSIDTAIAEIQRQKVAGADFIKVVQVSPPVFFAALDEAKRLQMPFAGHIPMGVNVAEAARKGMTAVEHLFGSLEASSTDEALLRPTEGPPNLPALGGANMNEIFERAVANPILIRPPSFDHERRLIETYSEKKCRELAAQFVAAGIWQIPTLIRLRTMGRGDEPAYRDDPALRYMPRGTRQMWEALAQQFAARIGAPTKTMLSQLFDLQSNLVTQFKQAGVKMLAGSDLGGQWCIPGIGLHQEFSLLSQAGLSPLEILQMTTLNGAKFLGREASMGSVEKGKNADLVVLEADPLAGVENLKRIHAVVRAGTYHSSAMLDALKKKTEERYSEA
jgi:imidazolonepropionase-like amidohydrolase